MPHLPRLTRSIQMAACAALSIHLGACQPIRVSMDDLNRTIVAADGEVSVRAADLFGPFSNTDIQRWITDSDQTLEIKTELENMSGHAVVTTQVINSRDIRQIQSVLRFGLNNEGDVELRSVERPRDDLELRFTPPLIIIPAELSVDTAHEASTTVISTRGDGDDGSRGTARVRTIVEQTVAGSRSANVSSSTAPDSQSTLTIELTVKAGPATWARKSIEALGTPSSTVGSARVQEQLRVLSILIRNETRTRVE